MENRKSVEFAPKKAAAGRRGYYSELVTDQEDSEPLQTGPAKQTKILWQVKTEEHAPTVVKIGSPKRRCFLAPAERWMCYEEEKNIVS